MPRIVASGTALMYLIPVAGELYVPPTEVGGMVDDSGSRRSCGISVKGGSASGGHPAELESKPTESE